MKFNLQNSRPGIAARRVSHGTRGRWRPIFGLLILPLLVLLATRAGAADFPLSTMADFPSALAQAKPGDTLTMKNGFWPDSSILFTGNGTAANPITLRAQTAGQVTLSGASSLRIAGNFLLVDGLKFMNG